MSFGRVVLAVAVGVLVAWAAVRFMSAGFDTHQPSPPTCVSSSQGIVCR